MLRLREEIQYPRSNDDSRTLAPCQAGKRILSDFMSVARVGPGPQILTSGSLPPRHRQGDLLGAPGAVVALVEILRIAEEKREIIGARPGVLRHGDLPDVHFLRRSDCRLPATRSRFASTAPVKLSRVGAR